MALQVEVYSRDPIFLREKLQGTATIVLREFLTKRKSKDETYPPRIFLFWVGASSFKWKTLRCSLALIR